MIRRAMDITFLDLKRQYLAIGDEVEAAMHRVLERQSFVLGEEVELFESEFAAYLDVPYAVSVGSGTDGLILSLLALGIGKGDEVIAPTNSFVATAQAIAAVGATPVLADVDPHTYHIDTQHLEERLTARTRAIIPVHLYGSPCSMPALVEMAERRGVALIEDACQSHGASFAGRKTGGFGDASVFSFYPSKNLGAYGDGGAVCTGDEETCRKLRGLRNYGQSRKYHHDEMGRNSRLDELQAAVLRVKLQYLDGWNARRRDIAAQYRDLLRGCRFQEVEEEGVSCYYVFSIETDRRDRLQEHLKGRGIETLVHYPVPIHLQKCFSHLGYGSGDLPVAEKAAQRILSLPMYGELREAEISYIADCVNEFTAKVGG